MEAATDFLENLGAIDALLLTLILLSCGFGLAARFTTILFTKLSIFAGIWFAFFNSGQVAEMLVQLGLPQRAAVFAAPVLIVSLVGLIGWLVSGSVVKILELLKLGFVNHLLGGCYGFLRIAALILASTVVGAYLGMLDKDFYERSHIMQASGWTLYQIKESEATPELIRGFLGSFSYDEDNWRPMSMTSAKRSAERPGRKRQSPPPETSPVSEKRKVAEMLENAKRIKDASDTLSGRDQQAEEVETATQKWRRWRRMSKDELRAELQATGLDIDERVLEDLIRRQKISKDELHAILQTAEANIDERLLYELAEDESQFKKYLERFKQQYSDSERQE